jgi:hypothetical protein
MAASAAELISICAHQQESAGWPAASAHRFSPPHSGQVFSHSLVAVIRRPYPAALPAV